MAHQHKHTRHHNPRLETLAASAPDDRIHMGGRDERQQLEREREVLRRLRAIHRAGGVVTIEVIREVLAEFPATGEDDGGELLTRLRTRLPW